MNRDETSRLINETGVVPKKSKGQNFLTDERVALRHVDYAEIEKGDRVLEVGPGLGILTSKLIEVSDDVTCIELDEILAEHIRNTYGDRLKLIEDLIESGSLSDASRTFCDSGKGICTGHTG